MKKLSSYFLQGLIYVGPIAITLYVVFQIFYLTDNLLQTTLFALLGYKIPGLGILIILSFLTILGFVGQTIIAQPFKKLFHRVIKKVPLLELIYSAVNDFFSAVVGKERKFSRPVLVRLSHLNNIERIGFITEDDLKALGITDKVAVYFPLSYSFAGEVFVVPKELITVLKIPASEAMKFVVSGGVAEIE